LRQFGVFLTPLTRSLVSGFGFWLIHPLWLAWVWSLQGYFPTGRDFVRWYALGAFNAAPVLSAALVGLLWGVGLVFWGSKRPARVLRWAGALTMCLAVPPIAYGLLLWYAGVLPFADVPVALPTLGRAYLYLGGTCFGVGWLMGAPLKTPSLVRRV
jgi:hypothetical protein